MKKSFCFVVYIALLNGCTHYSQTYLESGEVGYSIGCSSYRSVSWNACYIKAGEICGNRGYEVISKIGSGIDRSEKHLWIKCN